MSLPETRPMDEIKINADLPGEEEHSLGAIDKYGFFHSMIFPRNFKTYASYKSFENAKPKDLERWKKRYAHFIKKIAYKNEDKKLVLKNPANTYRVKHLIEMYPNAKFIHLYRNPYEVYASSIRFHLDTFGLFSLQTWNEEKVKQNVLDIYNELYIDWEKKIQDVPKENWLDVKYEDFIKEPMKTLEEIYRKLDIQGFSKNKEKFIEFIESQKDYQPRTYEFTDEFIAKVNDECDHIFKLFDYKKK
jgi:hypothetical protein